MNREKYEVNLLDKPNGTNNIPVWNTQLLPIKCIYIRMPYAGVER